MINTQINKNELAPYIPCKISPIGLYETKGKMKKLKQNQAS